MRQIFIHVGAGKTGTSAIQEFLKLNRLELEANNLKIPDSGLRVIDDQGITHHDLAGKVSRDYCSDVLDLWRKLIKEEGDRFLVTSERFHSLIKYNTKIFEEIRNILDGFDVSIIFYIRREDQWIQSAYEQWIKAGNKRDGEAIHELIKKPSISLPEQVLRFADIFGPENIILKPFEKSQFAGGNIFSDFFSIFNIDVNDDFLFPKKNSNPRLSIDALEFKRIFNTICANPRESRSINSYLTEYSSTSDASSTEVFRKANLLSEADREIIARKNEPLYKNLAKEFLGRDDGRLFYESYDVEPVDYKFSLQDLTKISSFLFLKMSQEIDHLKREQMQLEKDNKNKRVKN